MSNLEKPLLYFLVLASLGACKATVGTDDDTADNDEDETFADGAVVVAGCPDAPGDLGALTGTAEVFTNTVVTHVRIEAKQASLGLFFTRIENTREMQAMTYTLNTTKTANTCLADPSPAECAAIAIYASDPHQKMLSTRSGTITVATADMEGLGRATGSFANLLLAEVDADGLEFVTGGCTITIPSGTFDLDLTLPGGGGPPM